MFGFLPSPDSWQDMVYNPSLPGFEIPAEYSFLKYMPEVYNQGNLPYCVPCSLMAWLEWKQKTADDDKALPRIKDIYEAREDKYEEGMDFKSAFKYLREQDEIKYYSRVGSILHLKSAIFFNGPCFGALPVYDTTRNEFWEGENLIAYHAVSIIGYLESDFIIRNSWGREYGKDGYWTIGMEKAKELFKEIWTIIK